ncbi:hypothetical protein LU699_10420 [Luteimonas fraxinea]|uniref:Uncharacterized protein n=1 Tax=Luteimonas fraxinea TaxID=2901869 RepID=A0ABS8UIM3_9GAMM|nr:hypothetical protein [Luteimonas fraxinea]MCD9098335.1 hypothetical protein [Luteimonas fraxinea]MCD9127067.1 hypothetical protein [Luteimonas fraxinea]UHH08731.1 hypothetical protein LU699_10420 [Luteimonas fraxinea]
MSAMLPIGLTRMSMPLVVWALHFVVVYSLQGLACARALWRAPVAGLETMTWVLWALTLLALGVIALFGASALRAWRIARAQTDGRTETSRLRFLTALSALVALIAAIGVAFTALPVALLPTCA